MANEFLAALLRIKADAAAITGVQRAQLGQPLTALPEATQSAPVACVFCRDGVQDSNDAYTMAHSSHIVELRFYWLLTPANVEIVEQSLATFIDRVATKYNTDLNLGNTVTVALLSGENEAERYTCGYSLVADKLHRILSWPLLVELDTQMLSDAG